MHRLIRLASVLAVASAVSAAATAAHCQTPAAPAAGPATAPGNPVVDQQATTQQKPAAAPQAASGAVVAGFGNLTIGGVLQFWAAAGSHPDTTYIKAGGFGFKARRMELHLDGGVDPRLSYHLNADFARGSSTVSSNGVLQDVFLAYSLGAGQDLLVGQTKLPMSETGIQSSAQLLTVERPLFVVGPRGAGVPQWGDVRDIGVQYRLGRPHYSAQIALTEGAGDYQNLPGDTKYGKQVTAEFFFRPFDPKGLQLGITGSGGAGYNNGAHSLLRNRAGGSIRYPVGRWFFETEYMAGADGIAPPAAGGKVVTEIRHGEYGLAAYDLGGGYQGVVMLDYLNPGIALPRQTNVTMGMNHNMDHGHRRLQVNYIHEHYSGPFASHTSDNDELVAAAGVNW
ncbi:MAG: OprO/OprP family phosphate-selective porin [Chloroflexi bacterium]|nr:OprO/OprP family phosphate-selective porin [Chloroflexota bacterium]